ncbi:hypothetical protein H0O02_04075 [Candidatus Micrarchaeota archaeon]|nr:hypothetical protein [Candidatus Micrarchaeota archaeon]
MSGETKVKLDDLLQRAAGLKKPKAGTKPPAVEGPVKAKSFDLDAELKKANTDIDKSALVGKLLNDGKAHEALIVAKKIDVPRMRVESMVYVAASASKAGNKDAARIVLEEALGEAKLAGEEELEKAVENTIAKLEQKPAAAPRKEGGLKAASLGRLAGRHIQPPPPPTGKMKEKAEEEEGMREESKTMIDTASQQLPKAGGDPLAEIPVEVENEPEESTERIDTSDIIDDGESAPKAPPAPRESGMVVGEADVMEERPLEAEGEAATDEALTEIFGPEALTVIHEESKNIPKETEELLKRPATMKDLYGLGKLVVDLRKRMAAAESVLEMDNLKALIGEVVGDEPGKKDAAEEARRKQLEEGFRKEVKIVSKILQPDYYEHLEGLEKEHGEAALDGCFRWIAGLGVEGVKQRYSLDDEKANLLLKNIKEIYAKIEGDG